MITRLCLIIWLTISFQVTFGQDFSTRIWHSGWLVTSSNDTIRGDIKYDLPTNTVQILVSGKNQKKIYTFSSKKLMYFEIFDSTLKNYRQFYSIPYQVRSDYKVPILFEILYEGPLTLLLREKIVIETDNYQSYTYTGVSPGVEKLVFTYYFVDKTGEIVLYEGRKGEIYGIFKKHHETVREYIKKNKLRVDKMSDLVRVTAFYNSL